MSMKEEFTAHDMATAAADGFRAGQRAAQSAPAGEREAVEQQIVGRYTVHPTGRGFWPYCVRAGDGERELFVGHKRKCEEVAAALQVACLDGAFMQSARQRTQSEGVPEWFINTLLKSFPMLKEEGLDEFVHCCEFHIQRERKRLHQIIAGAPAQPAAQGEFSDAYQGAREDLAIWKRRALEAEQKIRHQEQIIDQLTLEAQGETRFGEPSLPAAGSADLTAVRCQCCATEYPHDSYDAGFIAGSGMCQVCDAAMPPKDLPAAGSAVEEVDLFNEWFGREVWTDGCYGNPDILRRQLWPCWQARAALSAQQSAPERVSVSRDLLADLISSDHDTKIQAERALYAILASQAEGGKV